MQDLRFYSGDYEEFRLLGSVAVLILLARGFSSLKMEAYVPPKHWFLEGLHGATSHKTAFLILYMFINEILQ
jgi:hypothetical protein